jgi:hypothetical protein
MNLWIILSDRQSEIEILLCFFKFLQIKMALSSMHQELCVLIVSLHSIIVVLQSFLHLFQSMITAPKSIRNTMILLVLFKRFKLLTKHEVFDAFMELFGIQFTKSSSEVSFRKLWVKFNRLVEIVDGELMVTHVLIDHSSSDENCFVVWNLFQNFTEALKCFLELICFVIHQSKMETTTDEVFLEVQGLLEHLYCS